MNDKLILIMLLLFAAFLFYLSKRQKAAEKEKERREKLNNDYPELINKMVLLIRAGLVVRSTFFRIAEEYKKEKRKGKNIRPAFEEVVRCCVEMEKGVGEIESYHNFGKRCVLPCYRTLAMLMVQNVKNGGNGLVEMLEREMINANENRKRTARINGEKASIKLLLPMGLMLAVVLAIMIVPAFMSI